MAIIGLLYEKCEENYGGYPVKKWYYIYTVVLDL